MQMKQLIRRMVPKPMLRCVRFVKQMIVHILLQCFFGLCNLLPLQNKVVSSTFEGRRYGDNTQYILEELHTINPKIKIVWIKDKEYIYNLPEYFKVVNRNNMIQMLFNYYTAKVWVDTHHVNLYQQRRKNTLFVETWHGGLGIKRVGSDSQIFRITGKKNPMAIHTASIANLFISNSDHLTSVFRNAFGYHGVIWKCGYPKTDVFFSDSSAVANQVRQAFGIPADEKIIIYAPTFRGQYMNDQARMYKTYGVDFDRLLCELESTTSTKWTILIRMHPDLQHAGLCFETKEHIKDATMYPDMQKLLLAADAFISDYSSCIFDAALRNIPCFTFATDFEEYKGDRGVYYDMEELPFPYAKNNDELVQNIRNYDHEAYLQRWEKFKVRTGLYETGHAGKDIANLINEYIKGNRKPLDEIKSEP